MLKDFGRHSNFQGNQNQEPRFESTAKDRPTIIGLAVVGGIIAATELGQSLSAVPSKATSARTPVSASITRRDRSITVKRGSIGFQASDGFALRRMRVRQDGGSPKARMCIHRAQSRSPGHHDEAGSLAEIFVRRSATNGYAYTVALEAVSNPCTACSAPVHGLAWTSDGARCSVPPFDACCSQDSHFEIAVTLTALRH